MAGNFKIPESEWLNVVNRYKECESTIRVAREYGVSYPTILSILKRMEVPRTGKGQIKIPKSTYASIALRYKDSGSIYVVAKEFSVSGDTICYVLAKLGIPRDGHGKISSALYPAMVGRYKECENASIVAEEFGMSSSSAQRIFAELGVTMTGKKLWPLRSPIPDHNIIPNNMDEGLSEDQLREFLIKAGFDYDEEE